MQHLTDFILADKYSVYEPELRRRLTWEENVDRLLALYEEAAGSANIAEELRYVREFMLARRVMPSMRSLQFSNKAIKQHNMRLYNCVGMDFSNPRKLAEAMYCLLCGAGTGFRVASNRVWNRPAIKETRTYSVPDSIEGWVHSIDLLMHGVLNGVYVNFSYERIRPKGTPLSSGGKAPGLEPLRLCHHKLYELLYRTDVIDSLVMYDCAMYVAEAVLSGGIRRAATIALFDPYDTRMRTAKTGEWFQEHPERSFSNISAHTVRGSIERSEYDALFEATREYGEPGIYFVDDPRQLTNPCGEIVFTGYEGANPNVHTQVCNLTTINAGACDSRQDFYEAARAAGIIGTFQSLFCNFGRNLDADSQRVIQRDRLLGVSICGILDRYELFMSNNVLRKAAGDVLRVNEKLAYELNIPVTQRATTVKPEGTASLVLQTSAGVHPRWSSRYFRRVQINKQSHPGKVLREKLPECVLGDSVYDSNSFVAQFPVEAPAGAKLRDDMTALEFLNVVNFVRREWCAPGSRTETSHNVSNTVSVRDNEWDSVRDYIWKHRESFGGVSLLSDTGDLAYEQAPQLEVRKDDPVALHAFNELREVMRRTPSIDYTTTELDDTSSHQVDVTCAGGSCLI